MKHSSDKKVYVYDIQDEEGTPLELLNIQTFKDGKLDRVTTFIGRHDRDEYVQVANAQDLSSPGIIFKYSSYVREQESMLPTYLDCYRQNLHGHIYSKDGGSYYLLQE